VRKFLYVLWGKIPVNIRKIISPVLKYIICKVYNVFFLRFENSVSDKIVLSYGGVLPPKKSNIILSGGLVKIETLSKVYPESYHRHNILYLVSSSSPYCAYSMIKRVKNKNISFVWNQNGVAYPAWAGDDYVNINDAMRRCYLLADFIIYQSEFCKKSAIKFLGDGLFSEIIYNSINTDRFLPDRNINRSICYLLITGTHMFSYRVISALKCVAQLKKMSFQVKLTIAGKIMWKNGFSEINGVIRSLDIGDLIDFYPPYTRNEAPGLYKNHHILLHAQYNDASPTVPLEAMSCGLPVVGSSSGGMPEIVTNETGILLGGGDSFEIIEVLSEDQMAKAVITIWDDYANYSIAARTRAEEKFDDRIWLEKHKSIFESLLRNNK